MSNYSVSITFDLVTNLIAGVCDTIAILVSVVYLCLIIYRLIRMKRYRQIIRTDVSLILSINIICILIIKSILQIIHITIPTVMKDFLIITEFRETSLCRYRMYAFWSTIVMIYWDYVLLAFFSFARVIFPTKVWLHRPKLYLYVLIPGVYITVSILLSPLLFIFDTFHIIPNEAYCGMESVPPYPLLYANCISFFIPVHTICIFYMYITRKMRQLSLIRQVIDRRDYIVTRRIFLNVIVLTIFSVPYVILYVKSAIENHFESILHRVLWVSSAGGSTLYACTLPMITTRLRDFLKPNRVRQGVR